MNNIEILENAIKCNKKQFEEIGTHILLQDDEMKAIENLIKENKELKEYKKIAELTKISCCTAQNCEALNNAIKNGLENEKLLQKNKELKEKVNRQQEQLNIANKKILAQKGQLKVVNNSYIPKSKIKEIIYPIPENYIPLEVQTSEMYKKLEKLVEGE